MRARVGCCSVWAALTLMPATFALAEPLRVFTDHAHPLQLADFTDTQVIYLDGVKTLEAALSEGLSAHPEQAEQQALALLHSARGQQLQAQLQSAYAGLAQAWHLGITHLPAVVMDGYVVYGETNIARAVQRIDAFKAGYKP